MAITMLIERLSKDYERIAKVGEVAIREARAAAVPVYFIDQTVGAGIVKMMPDGTCLLIDADEERDVVLHTFASA
jgi:hypothetical protein